MGRFFFFYSFLCFVLLRSGCFSSSFDHQLCSPTEASALLQFKQSFGVNSDYSDCFTSFPKTKSWNESRDCCTWDGVTCDMLNGHVIDLDLSCSQLGGSIHPNSSLFQLHHLHTLNLAYNYFNYSSIPHNIGQLTNLRHLNLSEAYFSGKIPIEISYLSNLVSLDLSVYGLQLDERTFETMLQDFTNLEVLSLYLVNISSPLPVNISSSLRYVDLTDTNLRGVLTESFFLVPNLERLKLRGNDLVKGVFPKIHRSNTLLMELDISYTGISGELPHSIGTLKSLNILNLEGCQFSGCIPDSIGNLTQITELILSLNHFTGHIPSTISKLKHLTNLHLSSNSFSGEIPDVFSNLQELRFLDLFNNSFIGSFPSSISNLTHLQRLALSSNSLSGPLPNNASNLQKLTQLDLYDNLLNGTIPSWLFSLHLLRPFLSLSKNQFSGLPDELKTNPALIKLDLSNNQLSGSVPQSLVNLTYLYTLDLSSNNITGPFPASILSLTHLEYLDLSSNSLSGPLPSNASMLQELFFVDLSYNSLNGTIPSWNLPLLSLLWLNHNQLSGSFPQSLVNFTNLSTLDLSSNNITIDEGINITFPSLEVLKLSSCELKDFPHFLRNVKTLQVVDISNNKICGQIPNWFSGMRWDSLQYLDMKFNSLQGPLPSSICNMSKLTLLDFSHNYFSDSVPHCLGSMAFLTVLDLRKNNFTGSLPPLCAHSTSLSTIVVNGNRFEGPVPVSLLKCNGIEVLDVGNNAINDMFPAWLGTLQELQVLILKSNKFHGPISTCQTKFCFPKLRIFDLSRNDFSGSLPAKVFGSFKAMIKLDGEDTGRIKYMEPSEKSFYISYEDSVSLVIKGHDIELQRISTIMTTIDLSSNHFEGVIPKTLKDLSSLWLLNLSHNNLIGGIPMQLGKLNTLEALDLSWNRLTGKIPQELTRMNFLAYLNVSQNHLVGPIPHGLQFNTFENDSYGGNLDLCGPPLSKQCGTSDSSHVPQPLESEDEGESYFFSGFTWESIVIGYSFGLVVGTVMWSLMFKYRKPKWFVEFFDGLMPHKRRRPKKRAQRRRT
ncbi:hypothetical protein KY289_009643 [Solanum tuberosum]|nr:hypothetical protein KY289_009643 [Solanum tuberosum]